MVQKRIEILDILRGFALLGIILVNVKGMTFMRLIIPNGGVDAWYDSFLSIFVESKFFAIFSTLFGIGFYIFMERARQKSQNKFALYIRRLVILLVFGVFHTFLQPGEALKIYAVVGLLLLLFYYLKKEINLVIGLALLVVMLILDDKILLVIPYFILGLTLGQYGLFEKLKMYDHRLKQCWAITSMLALVSFILLSVFYAYPNFKVAETAGIVGEQYVQSKYLFDYIVTLTSPVISLFYVLTIIIIAQTEIGHKLLSPLKYYGRLALTNYIGQTLLMLVYTQLILKGSVSLTHSLIMCLVIYVIQIAFSKVWLTYFTYGPLEYIWRCGTYMRVIKIKK